TTNGLKSFNTSGTERVLIPLLEGATSGSILANPAVTFGNGAAILIDGTRPTSIAPLTFTFTTPTVLGDIATQNLGGGRAGWVALSGTGSLTVGDIATSAVNNNAGSILLSITGSGNLV